MPLPRIEPYDLPDARCLSFNRVDWSLEPARAVLLVHDMQNHFLRAFGQDHPGGPAARNIGRLLVACRRAGVPVVYTAQPPRRPASAHGLLTEFRGPGLGHLLDDHRITGLLEPLPGETVVTKHRYSAFHGTILSALLALHGRNQLLVTGVHAHLGCLLTTADAFALGLQAFFVADALADYDEQRHWHALRYVAESCGVLTVTEQVVGVAARSGRGREHR
ncbi:isochorismatase family protein [Kitasatospora sp. NPDC001660]